MRLRRVTIAGVDDSVRPAALLDLGFQYPCVEWGILYSLTRQGSARYPSQAWLARLYTMMATAGWPTSCAAHLCGRMVMDVLAGEQYQAYGAPGLPFGARIQLNVDRIQQPNYRPASFVGAIRCWSDREIIVQIGTEGRGRQYLHDLRSLGDMQAVPLFDASGGRGISPATWPDPETALSVAYRWYGYAGNLGPDTLHDELPRIAQAAGDRDIWIDMESVVRTAQDTVDLGRIRAVLDAVQPWIETHEALEAFPS